MILRRWTLAAIVLVAASLVMLRFHRLSSPPALPAARMAQEPSAMLWAWETPEDFTTLEPNRAGVAFLARELLLGGDMTVRPRRQPLLIPAGAWLMAVVRVETGPHFTASDELAGRAARAIAEAAQLPNVRAVQVDFDATFSQQNFYATLLRKLREDLPKDFPLSITALVSWCGPHSWLQGASFDEAVPMFFRMGGPASTRATKSRSQSVIAEPLCSGAVGVSTDEVWPAIRTDQRVYLFQPGPWTQNQIALINRFGYQRLRGLPSP